jgi:thioredoxin reductase
MKRQSNQTDYLIIGAGPAGLQLAYLLHRAGSNYCVLEAAPAAGKFFERFPRHRTLISINKTNTGYMPGEEVNLRYDWNSLISDELGEMSFGKYTQKFFPHADYYVRYLQDFANHFSLNIRYNTKVDTIYKDEIFHIRDESGAVWTSPCLIVATGTSLPYTPNIPGIELAEHYTEFTLDEDHYRDKRVLILGKGNSAFEMADYLTGTAQIIHICSPQSIEFAWKTHYIANLRAVNTSFIDTYVLKQQNSILDADVDLIERDGDEYLVHLTFTHAGGQRGILAYDRVLSCTGFRFDDSIFGESCRPEMVIRNKLPAMTSEWESTNIKNLFFAGAIMQMRDFHKTNSNVVHGFRNNIKALSGMLISRFEGKPLPCHKLPIDTQKLTEHIIERVSVSAPLFLQPGFLCDVLVISDKADEVEYYDGLPIDYIHDSFLGKNGHYYVISLEYGEIEGDLFRIERDPDPGKAFSDAYIHPIVRRYSGSVALSEHHIPDNLENDWRSEKYPGKTPMMRYWEYVGEKNPRSFKEIFTRDLKMYLDINIMSQKNMSN